jgi:hypothetical protein
VVGRCGEVVRSVGGAGGRGGGSAGLEVIPDEAVVKEQTNLVTELKESNMHDG